MRRSRVISTVVALFVALWLLSWIFASPSVPEVASYYPARGQELANGERPLSHHQRPGKQDSSPLKDGDLSHKDDSNGKKSGDRTDLPSSDTSNNSPNKGTQSEQSAPSSKGDKSTHNEQQFNEESYSSGLKEIKRIISDLADIRPGSQPFTVENSYFRDIKSDTPIQESGELPATSMILGLYLQVTEQEKNALSESHQRVMSTLPTEVPKGAYSGRGIVMTGGGKYFPIVLTALKWLRDNDPHTPVEIFMADSSEYEKHFCDDLFPKLNVECRVLEDIYGSELSSKLKSQYAFKPLAILASKFDDVYFMDADSYPINSVGELFDWDVYQDTGYILNSDLWPRYISPRYYDVVGITLGGRARGKNTDHALLQSDRENAVPGLSTESGQVYVRKSQHIRSLMLAMYYNLYGPGYYFPLLMQNGHGEGDKDTYAAAALVCNESYYQSDMRPSVLGQHLGGDFKVHAMVQPDPRTDYEKFVLEKDVEVKSQQIHINGVKSNIKYLMMDVVDPIRGAPRLRQQRYLGNMDDIKREGRTNVDVEERLFRTMGDVTCGWALKDGFIPKDWEDQDLTRLCSVLRAHTKWLKEHPDVQSPDDAPFWYDLYVNGMVEKVTV